MILKVNEKSDFTKREGTQSDTQDGMLRTVLTGECIWRGCVCVCVYACA